MYCSFYSNTRVLQHLQTEASPHLLDHRQHAGRCCCLSPPSRLKFPSCSPTLKPLALFPPHRPSSMTPLVRSHSKMKASGALVGPLTRKSLEPPKYISCSRTIKFQALTQGVIKLRKRSWHSTRVFLAGGGRQPLVWTFLGRGMNSLRDDEDTVSMAADVSRTYLASRRGVEPISLSPTHMKGSSSPSWSGVTHAGGGCPNRPEGSPPSTHRSRALSTRKPHLKSEKRQDEGEMGEAELSLVPSPPHQRMQIY
jgi:hypothetical protein